MPVVSIVTATYNRSNILRYSIDSVRASTFTDWEMIVVGDACTDDSADLVTSYGDARLRFVNLRHNVGEQSGPNNHGVTLARGRFIAFLNHDDLWAPDHLTTALAELDVSGADLVFTMVLGITAAGNRTLFSTSRTGSYDVYSIVPASCWVFRRELAERVGPWRPAQLLFLPPSQDWIFRAWKLGAQLRAVPRVTVVALPSSERRGSYAERQSAEHAAVAARLRDNPRFFEEEITTIAAHGVAQWGPAVLSHAGRAAKNMVLRAGVAIGLHPLALRAALLGRRRGGLIDQARETRGLLPLGRSQERPS